MAILKPFRGYRPPQDIVKDLASRPYDVLNSEEARQEAGDNPYSFLRVVKPEVELPQGINLYSKELYDKARSNFEQFIEKGYLKRDEQPMYYVYAQTWGERTQYGIVGCAGVEDYLNDIIKKHELTRPDKEEDRMKHVRITNANAEPVFFTYPGQDAIDALVAKVVENDAVYDFVADDGFGHKFWLIDHDDMVSQLEELFAQVDSFYVADGHHRTAAAALVGQEKKQANPNHSGDEPYNFFMAVLFPDDQLSIIDYNRVVKDLNGLGKEDFLQKLEQDFEVKNMGASIFKPDRLHVFSMYLDGEWYAMEAKGHSYNDQDPIGVLDVTILSKSVLDPILGIHNLRTDKRIDFVGGIRGLEELKRRVDRGEMQVAFALYPVTMKQLMDIADTGNIMPPKTTWFEPKLRSGLVVNVLD